VVGAGAMAGWDADVLVALHCSAAHVVISVTRIRRGCPGSAADRRRDRSLAAGAARERTWM